MANLFPKQHQIAFPQTLAAYNKVPVIGNRIFATLAKAQEYVDKVKGTAIPGIYLSVIADGENNGAYWVAQAAGYNSETEGVLLKIGEGSSGRSTTLAGLSDVTITSLSDGQVLAYDAASKKWINKTIEGGAGIVSIEFSLASDSTNAVSLRINDETRHITAVALKTALGLSDLAYQPSVEKALGYTPFNSENFTQENIKSKLGISDWALAKNGPSKSDVGLGNVDNMAAKDYFTELASNGANAVIITIGGVQKTITVTDLRSSLGLKSLAYKDGLAFSELKDGYSSFAGGTGIDYDDNGGFSLAESGVTAGTYTKLTVDRYGRATSGSALSATDIPDIKISQVTGLAAELGKYVLQSTYNQDIYGEDTGISARLAKLESMFSFDGSGNIKTTYNFYSTKQVSSGGKAGSTTSLVTVEPALTSGTLVATINGTKIYAPEASGGEVTLASLATAFNGGNLAAALTFNGNDSYGIFTATNNYCSIGSSSYRFYRAYINNVYAYQKLYIGGTSDYFSSKTTSIGSASTDYQIPSAKSVYTFVTDAISGIEGGSGESYTLPLASSTERGGIKIGFSEYGSGGSYYDVALQLSNEAGYVRITKSMISTILGYSPANPNSLPVATSSVLGGVKIGFTATSSSGSYYNIPVQLSSNKAYVQLTKAMITTALGYTPSSGSTSSGTANEYLMLNSFNGKTATVPNGTTTIIVAATTTLDLLDITPVDTLLTCVLHIVKTGSYALTIPPVSASGVMVIPSTGATTTAAVTIAGYRGTTIVWNPVLAKWMLNQ